MSEYPQQPYQPYAPQPYASQPYPAARTNTMAILSLVFAFVFSPLGIVFGHIAKGQIRQTGEGGGGLATAGLVLSYIFVGLTILYIVAIFVFIGIAGTGTYS